MNKVSLRKRFLPLQCEGSLDRYTRLRCKISFVEWMDQKLLCDHSFPFLRTKETPPNIYNQRRSMIFLRKDAELPTTFLSLTIPIASFSSQRSNGSFRLIGESTHFSSSNQDGEIFP